MLGIVVADSMLFKKYHNELLLVFVLSLFDEKGVPDLSTGDAFFSVC